MSITVDNRVVKTYWVKADRESEFLGFIQDGLRDSQGNHLKEINALTNTEETVDGVLRWLERNNVDPATVEFYRGGVPGVLSLFTVVTSPGGSDWAGIPGIRGFLDGNPPVQDVQLAFNREDVNILD